MKRLNETGVIVDGPHAGERTSLEVNEASTRPFVADDDLVGGYDPARDGFFCLAAQGGHWIQTSPAMGEACAACVRGAPIPERIQQFGSTATMLSPARIGALDS